MMRGMTSSILLVLLLVGCGPASVKGLGDDTGTPGHDSADTSDSADTTDSADTSDTAHTGETASEAVSDLAVRLHPSIASVVYVSWTQVRETVPVHVEYTYADGETGVTPSMPGTVGAHEQILLGIPYATPVTWRVVVEEDGGEAEGPGITTGPVPSALPDILLDTADDARWEPTGRYLLTSVSTDDPSMSHEPGFWVTLVDRQGRYVWAIPADPGSWTLFAKPSRDGTTILYDDDLFWTSFDGGVDSAVHQIKLDGSELRTWETPGLAHAYDDLSADTIAWARSGNRDDQLVISAGDAEARLVWSCLDWIYTSDIARSPDNPSQEQCGSNALSYNEDRDTYTISLWSHETVLELDGTSGEVLWYADPHTNHGYDLAGGSPVWEWQHEVQNLSEDRLLLSSGVDPQRDGSFRATAAYEYEIDHTDGTLTLVWSYTSEPEFAARFKGGVRRLSGGNTLQYYGSAGGVKEITPESDVVWQVRFDGRETTWTGRSYWLDDLYAFAP